MRRPPYVLVEPSVLDLVGHGPDCPDKSECAARVAATCSLLEEVAAEVDCLVMLAPRERPDYSPQMMLAPARLAGLRHLVGCVLPPPGDDRPIEDWFCEVLDARPGCVLVGPFSDREVPRVLQCERFGADEARLLRQLLSGELA